VAEVPNEGAYYITRALYPKRLSGQSEPWRPSGGQLALNSTHDMPIKLTIWTECHLF